MTRTGQLRTRVYMQSATVSASTAFNEPTEVWATDRTLWAERVDPAAREFLTGDQPRADVRAVWRIRYRSDVTNKHRFVEKGSTDSVWDIAGAVDPDGRRRWLDVRAVQRVD